MRKLKLWARKMLVVTLSAAMTVNSVDMSVLAADMDTSGSEASQKEIQITGFAPLEDSIREQVLAIGASEQDISFTDTLTVTMQQQVPVQEDTKKDSEQTEETVTEDVSVEQEAEPQEIEQEQQEAEPQEIEQEIEQAEEQEILQEQIEQAEEQIEQQTEVTVVETTEALYGITWMLDADKSGVEAFDSSEQSAGLCYVYTPVLPEKDAYGNVLTVADDTELPQIYVLIGGYQVKTLSNTETVNIADVEATGSNGQIIINSENLDQWNNKVLTGSVTSADLNDSAKGIVVDGVTLNLTIRDLTIDRKNFGSNSISAISLTNQAVLNLTLEGDNSLYGAYGGAGIGVPSGTALCITAGSSGSLYAKGGNMFGGAAGIGAISPGLDLNYSASPQTRTCGYIGIAGGNVKSEGGTYRFKGSEVSGAAGIGSSYGDSGAMIDITGGAVTAIGGMYAAGIGGGAYGSAVRITISGGTVIAEGTGKGAKQPAAIGRGVDMSAYGEDVTYCGKITLDGGNITAKGNIGYGYVYSDYYPSGENSIVTVSDQVFLTIDGIINDGRGSSLNNYELGFTVFDTEFTSDRTADITLDGSKVLEKLAAKMTMPGQVAFTLSFAHNEFSGEKTFVVSIDGKTYEAAVDFKTGQTKYNLTAGRELYPVSLEFYDEAITGNVAVDEISVKQNGTALKSTEFVHQGSIEYVANGMGKMMIFLPADENKTDITVKAAGINGSEAMTKTGLMIGKTGITTVSMCNGKLVFSAKAVRVNATDATLEVESNVMTWDLYIKQSNDQAIEDPEVIISGGTVYAQTAQKGEMHLEDLARNSSYVYYMVAKQGELVSEIVSVKLDTPSGAMVFWEDDTSLEKKYYEGFFNAVDAAADISPEGFTVQAQGSANWSGWLTLKKSCILDLNGQNVSMNGSQQCSLALGEGVSAVLTDSTGGSEYHNSATNGSYSFFYMASGSSLTIKGGSYYDYKELLKAQSSETQTGRTLTIEGGSFYGGNNIDIGDGSVVLSGGTFYGGLSVNGNYEIKEGYSVKYLTGSNQGTYTSTLPGMGEDIEIVLLPELTGSLDLKIGNGVSDKAAVGGTLYATFTDKDSSDGTYFYRWYSVDGDTETIVQESPETVGKTSSYGIKQADIGKQLYCEVTKKGTSGSVKSEKTYAILGYSIEGAVITVTQGNLRYDGTEKEPKIIVTLPNDGNRQITQGNAYEASYENNIHAGTARIIINGIGLFYGTAETTFTIGQKIDYEDLKIEGVEDTYEYTGEEIRPEIVVKDGEQVIPKSQYMVSYKDNVNPGTAVVTITGKDDGDYYFGDDNYKNFTIVHEHDWKYSANDTTIHMECSKAACTYENKRAMLFLGIENADNLIYNGKTQDVATVTQSPQGVLPEGTIKKAYIGDGLYNGLPKNAGSYTATMSVENGGVTYTATYDFEIRKAKTDIGTVTADVLNNTLDVNQVKLSRTDTTIPGNLRLKDVTELKYGTYDYSWVFEPEDSVNYETIDGTVSITVADTVAPRASYTIGESYRQEFRDTISYGYLCKNTETMEITFKDNLSGVAEKQYYIADSEITDFEGVTWSDYTGPIVLPLGRNRIVYVRVTDNAGNIAILNSDGLIVYQESVLESNELSYIYHETMVRDIYVNENGNSFYDLVDDSECSLLYEYYIVVSENGKMRLTLNSDYLDTLSVGTHTYKIKMRPQGVHECETIAYSFSIKVEKAELYVDYVQATDRMYDGSSLVDITEVTLRRTDGLTFMASSAEVSVDINGLQGTLEKADAGTYKSVTLPALTLTGTDVDSYVMVQPDSPVYVLPAVTISKKPAPVIGAIQKCYVYAKDIKEEINLKELLPADCGEAVFGNPTHGSGGYEHYETAPAVNGIILSYTAGRTTWEELQDDNGGELVIPVQMTNYEDTEIRLILSLRDQTNVKLKAGTEVRLKNNVLTYGEPLSKLTFEEAVFTDEAGNVIEGRLDWMDGAIQPHAGNSVGAWRFTPADAEYKTVEGTVDIVVNPSKPEIKNPAVAERTYNPAKVLEDGDLTGIVAIGINGTVLDGTWSWKKAGIVPTVGNSGYEAVFTPADTKSYTAVSTTVEVKVKKAEPVIVQKPAAAEIAYGESLASSVLSGGAAQHGISEAAVSGRFAWKDTTIKPDVADSNKTAYTLVFTPDDTANYETTETTITLNIKRAGIAPNLPASRMEVSYNCKTVRNVGLPEGWSFAAADLEKELTVGVSVYATAIYTGEGCGNYETESIVIELIRLDDTSDDDEEEESESEDGSSVTPAGTTTTPLPAADGKKQTPSAEPVVEPASKPAPAVSDNDKDGKKNKEPFIKGKDAGEGWQSIESQAEEALAGETIQVDMNGATVVPGEIFDSIKDRDVTITFDMGEGICWTVNGLDITAKNVGDIDFGVTVGEQAGRSIPVDVINNVTGERYSMNLTLAYDGEFGFEATLTINMDAANAGLYANLFYYNPASGKLEFMCAGRIDEAGNTKLTFSHASDYTIVIDTQPMDKTTVEAGAADDNSGSASGNGYFWILLVAIAAVLIAIGAGYVAYRRKENLR